MEKMTKKQLQDRMRRELDTYGHFNGEFRVPAELPTVNAVISRVLSQVTKGQKDPALVAILRKQVEKAIEGNTKSAEFLMDRVYGKPVQTVIQAAMPEVSVKHNVISIEEARKQ